MSRRRTGTRYVPVTISLKPSMVDDIEAKLGPKQSRSAWIAKAIQNELKIDDGPVPLSDRSTMRLLSEVRHRPDINGEMKGIIEYWLTKL
jgi:hypothetical protein